MSEKYIVQCFGNNVSFSHMSDGGFRVNLINEKGSGFTKNGLRVELTYQYKRIIKDLLFVSSLC